MKICRIIDETAYNVKELEELYKDSNYIDYHLYNGNADLLVKERISSDIFLRLVMKYHNPNKNRLTHCLIVKNNNYNFILTDCVINVEPDPKTKITIVNNAIKFYEDIFKNKPRIVNLLTPDGHVSISVPCSLENYSLKHILEKQNPDVCFDTKQFDYCISEDSREIKNSCSHSCWEDIDTQPDGNADIIVVNNLCEGNSLYKALMFNFDTYGFVVGANIPVILNSRSSLYNNETAIHLIDKE